MFCQDTSSGVGLESRSEAKLAQECEYHGYESGVLSPFALPPPLPGMAAKTYMVLVALSGTINATSVTIMDRQESP